MVIRRVLVLALAALVAGPLLVSGSALARGGGGGGGGRGGGGGGGGGRAKGPKQYNKQDKEKKKKDLELAREKLRQVDYRDRDSSSDRPSI